MRSDFAVFILSHGRADRLITVKSLEKCGYTGKWYIILDNEDKSINRYRELFGDEHLIVFDKLEASKTSDTCDTSTARNIVLFARNECHRIAKELGLTYFLELDDDYTEFRCRYDAGDKFGTMYVRDLDSIIDSVIEFLELSGAYTVAFAQTGDFIGGMTSNVWKNKLTRKAMNSFFCKVDRPFDFIGRINEDTTAYTLHGSRGKLFFTIADVSLDQCQTQAYAGGLTESYLENGTYVKSFYTVMNCPSCAKVATVGTSHKRFHHLVDWEHAVPKIISSKFKKI